MFGEGAVPTSDVLDYQMWGVPAQSGESPTIVDQSGSPGASSSQKHPAIPWSVNERFGHVGIGEPIAIPGTNDTVPQDLWSIETGGAYNHLFQSLAVRSSLNLNVGSDSDHPFYSIHETVFRAGANYRVPSGSQNAWLFFLNYSNNRHFFNNIPLPGFGYFFVTDENRLQGLVGFPFIALSYRPTPAWNAQLSDLRPAERSNAEIWTQGSMTTYGCIRRFQCGGSQEWLIADRPDYSDRLVFDKKRVALGVRSPLPYGFLFDVSGGRQFDQRFFVNDSSSYKDVPTEGLPPAWFVETRLSYRFAFVTP